MDMMTALRRGFALMALLAGLLCPLAPAAAADLVRLSMGSTDDPAYLPFFVGVDKGFYRELGLDVQIVYIGGGIATPALLSGSLEFSTSTGSAITAILKGGAAQDRDEPVGACTVEAVGDQAGDQNAARS